MKTIDECDISELMRIINYQMTENQQLKNGLAELKVKYKQIFEENRVLKVEKNRLLQKNTQLLKNKLERKK